LNAFENEENIWPKERGNTGRMEKIAQNEELHNLYFLSIIIIMVIKSWRVRWAGHVADTRMINDEGCI
jgi:hypothetical protein